MRIYQFMQIFTLSYTGFVLLFSLFMFILDRKFGSSRDSRFEKRNVLEKLRGRTTILFPLRVLSVIFLLFWLALVIPWIDVMIGTEYFAQLKDGNLVTWFGIFYGEQGDSYFFTVFITILGAKGFILVKHTADILSDTSMVMTKEGLMYKEELPW